MDYYYRPGENIEDYRILKPLGEGRYGICYLAEDAHHDQYVIKQLKEKMLRVSRSKLFFEETILKELDDPHFPRFVTTFHNHRAQGYIMEYKKGRVFEDLVREGHRFSRVQIYAVASRLISLIALLEDHGIVHRDIRLPNVILAPDHELVLIDFGLARYIDHDRYVRQMDFWYLGDFLIHLYYTAYYKNTTGRELPWYRELDLTHLEKRFLKKLMGLERDYNDINDVKYDLLNLKYAL